MHSSRSVHWQLGALCQKQVSRAGTSNYIQQHYNDVIMGAMVSQITSLTIVYSTVYSGADHRKHQSSASLVFVRGIHRCPVISPHKGPVTRKIFLFADVIWYLWIAITCRCPWYLPLVYTSSFETFVSVFRHRMLFHKFAISDNWYQLLVDVGYQPEHRAMRPLSHCTLRNNEQFRLKEIVLVSTYIWSGYHSCLLVRRMVLSSH